MGKKRTLRDEDVGLCPLVAGRTAQAFNRRKKRKGAYWEDRYHATAIESGEHLLRCLVYMDMNMVRAGIVRHPSQWQHCGYHEIQSPPQRYRLIDRDQLINLTGAANDEQLNVNLVRPQCPIPMPSPLDRGNALTHWLVFYAER